MSSAIFLAISDASPDFVVGFGIANCWTNVHYEDVQAYEEKLPTLVFLKVEQSFSYFFNGSVNDKVAARHSSHLLNCIKKSIIVIKRIRQKCYLRRSKYQINEIPALNIHKNVSKSN